MALVAIFPSVIPASFQAGVMTGVCLPSPALWSPSANAFTGSEYAAAENCPLNVCCSEYGFCGTTTDFCGDSSVAEPVCSGTSATARTIGYYEGWNLERPCDTMPPSDIPVGGYTHLNFAFLYIDPDLYTITPMETSQQDLYAEGVDLHWRLEFQRPGVYTEYVLRAGGFDRQAGNLLQLFALVPGQVRVRWCRLGLVRALILRPGK